MRVLHFAHSFVPQPGGTTVRLSNMLASPDNEHELIVPWPSASNCVGDFEGLPADEAHGNIHVHRLSAEWGTRFGERIPFWRDHLQSRLFVRRAVLGDVDILHGHNPMSCALAAIKIKRRHGLPLVYEAHGIMHDLYDGKRMLRTIAPLNRLACNLASRTAGTLEQRVVKAADSLIAQTEISKRRLMELYGLSDRPIDVIRNGVDAERFSPTRWVHCRDELRARHGWGDRVVCLYAGYLNPTNGIDFLIDALPNITGETRSRLKIALVGRGPLEARVRQAEQEHGDILDYLGVAGHDEMPAYYAACDLFTIPRPSHRLAELFLPMKLLEAMAMEIPVVVSNVAAMAEVVRDGENGMLFRKGSASAFVEKLESAAAAPAGQLAALGTRARQDVLDRHTWDASRAQLQAAYERVAALAHGHRRISATEKRSANTQPH